MTDEQLALVESLFFSPTWPALCQLMKERQEDLKETAIHVLQQTTSTEHPLTATILSHRADEYTEFMSLMDARFNKPEEPKEPESNPKSFSDLMP